MGKDWGRIKFGEYDMLPLDPKKVEYLKKF